MGRYVPEASIKNNRLFKVLKVFIFLFIAGLIVILDFLFGGCEIDRNYSFNRVMKHLESKGLDPIFLQEDRVRDGECVLSYTYKSETEDIHFMVIDGFKVTYWDSKVLGPE